MTTQMTALAALMLLAAAPALAQNAGTSPEPQTTGDGLGLAFTTDVPHRYVAPRAVGFSPENIPASALTPVPPNYEQFKRSYALGEASVDAPARAAPRTRRRMASADAKGRATYDRHPSATAWARRHRYD